MIVFNFMKKELFNFFLFTVVSSAVLFGQGETPIQLDRPDQTECPFIVPNRFIQMENGFAYENTDEDLKSYSLPSILWKYGINDWVEFRLITEVVMEKEPHHTFSGLNPVTVGFKVNFTMEKGVIPATSFIGHIATAKGGSKAFHSSYIAPSFRFAMQHTLSDWFSLAYNVGAEWNGETAEQTYIYTLVTGISLTEKFGAYAEFYGFAPVDSKPDHRFDCGLTFLVNNDFMVDVSGGIGLTINAPRNYIAVGISYRFNTAKS